MYFVDLDKAYDLVDRTFLWTGLGRFGVPQEMHAIIRHFHNGMRARIRKDYIKYPDWFNVRQGLHHG